MTAWLLTHWYLYGILVVISIVLMHYGSYPLPLYASSVFTDFKGDGHRVLLIAIFGVPMFLFHELVLGLQWFDEKLVNYF